MSPKKIHFRLVQCDSKKSSKILIRIDEAHKIFKHQHAYNIKQVQLTLQDRNRN